MSSIDTIGVTQRANNIARLTKALAWLKEYGHTMNAKHRYSFDISVRPISASTLPGAKEAEEQMTAVARLHIENIVQHAIVDAENTIEIEKSWLREALK